MSSVSEGSRLRGIRDRELLYRFHKELNRPHVSPHDLTARALALISAELPADRYEYFKYDPLERRLSKTWALEGDVALENEEAFHPSEGTPLWELVEGDLPVHQVTKPRAALLAPLRWPEGNKPALGLLRLERLKGKPFSPRERQLACGYAGELAQNLYQARLDQQGRAQLKRLQALTDLTAIFASSLRVEEGVRLILQGIQSQFAFDRVRLYLVEKDRSSLRGELRVDMRGRTRSLMQERYPLKPGQHHYTDLVWATGTDPSLEKFGETILYVPLTVSGQSIGLLIVDNLVSQQPIRGEDVGLIKSFAGQIALAVDNARLFEEVQELSLHDSLTGLPVRRYFNQRFQEELYRATRFGQPLSLVWMDVDYFKQINDTYGHQVGDQALEQVGAAIRRSLRKIDFPCRYGGDEILILLPQSREEDAKLICQRLIDELRQINIPVPFAKIQKVQITVSVGIATFPSDAKSSEELLQKADEALYWVKSHGKNGLALFSQTSRPPNPPQP
jgi:diguanylate cyclase (GGDEF)-like protein